MVWVSMSCSSHVQPQSQTWYWNPNLPDFALAGFTIHYLKKKKKQKLSPLYYLTSLILYPVLLTKISSATKTSALWLQLAKNTETKIPNSEWKCSSRSQNSFLCPQAWVPIWGWYLRAFHWSAHLTVLSSFLACSVFLFLNFCLCPHLIFFSPPFICLVL